MIPLTGTRTQPAYSVGFQREAFTKEQLEKLSPFIGDFIAGDLSYFMATYYMYSPFLTCDATALIVADRQNAHSMTLVVRGVVELVRPVGCGTRLTGRSSPSPSRMTTSQYESTAATQ